MLTRLLGSLRSRSGDPAASDAPPTATVHAPARVVAPSARAVSGAAAGDWQAALAAGCESLRATLSAEDVRRGDAERVLAALGADGTMAMRQPPAAAQEALRIARNPDCGLAELTRLVGRDPLLTQGLLRYAGSAFHATSTSVLSVDAAVHRLGAKGVQTVVLSTMVESLLGRPGAEYSPLMLVVWDHMVRTAPLARALASAFDVAAHDAFVVGLLHDVGKLVLFDRLAAVRADRRRDLQLPAGLIEGALRTLHEPLGALAMRRWELGDRAAQAIATHHRAAPPAVRDRLAEVVHVAEKVELCVTRRTPLALDRWWRDAHLTGDRARAGEVIDGAMQRASAASG
jgi:HD-like signal output (HDOD) protein